MMNMRLNIGLGLTDVFDAIKNIYLPFYLAIGDTRSRYKRSTIGPLWIVLSTTISIVGLGFVWSAVMNVPAASIVPSLTVGLVIWQWCSVSLLESPSLFLRNSAIIRNVRIPFSMFVLQILFKNLIALLHNLVVVFSVLIFYPPEWGLSQLSMFPLLMLLFAFLFGAMLFLSVLGAQFRDVEQIVSSLMPIVFFLTPIIFRIDQLNVSSYILYLNPLTFFIGLLRDSIFGLPINFNFLIIASLITCLSLAIGIISLNKSYKSLPIMVS
jgi:ABC-type polysaccharide/polyol phosphate export permease